MMSALMLAVDASAPAPTGPRHAGVGAELRAVGQHGRHAALGQSDEHDLRGIAPGLEPEAALPIV